MRPVSITSEWYFSYAQARIEQLRGAAPNTSEAEELERLTELVVEYEMRMSAKQRQQA